MLKFKFNYLQNTLAYQKEDNLWRELAEDRQFTDEYGKSGFKLKNGWMIFTIYEEKVRVFYKKIETPARFTYYRKDLPKEVPAIFEFTEQDEMEKINGKWTKKGEKPWEY